MAEIKTRTKLRSSFLNAIIVSAIVILVIYTYWYGMVDMVTRWGDKEEYGYAYFLPFITGYLIWQRRYLLLSIQFESSWIGVMVLVCGGFFYFIGEIATSYTLVQYSLVITVLGITLAFLGWKAFTIVAGPLFLLFFMVPLPPFIFNNISGKLQLLSSQLGVDIIRLFGVSVYLEGNVIDLGDYKLQVVEACSGLRYLFPLISLSYLAAYLYRVEIWKRALVFFSSIPITVIMNSLRIGVIGVVVDKWGQEHAEGLLHYFEGWVVFMACLVILILEMTILQRIGGGSRRLRDVFGLDIPAINSRYEKSPSTNIPSVSFGVLLSLVLIATSSQYIKTQDEVIPKRISFNEFPTSIGDWNGDQDRLEDMYLQSLKLDDYIIADYYNDKRSMVNFYAAYYASQQAGSAAHSPRSCIPGGGWDIEEVSEVSLPAVHNKGMPLRVNRLVIKKGDIRQLVYYWFQQRGRIITNEWLVKWYLFTDGLMHHRTDGALIRITTAIALEEDWKDGDARLSEFAKRVVPMLDVYIPE